MNLPIILPRTMPSTATWLPGDRPAILIGDARRARALRAVLSEPKPAVFEAVEFSFLAPSWAAKLSAISSTGRAAAMADVQQIGRGVLR